MYQMDPHKHVRIWFSNDPDTFLNPENQLRMVRFRADHPTAVMTLVYSSSLLNKIALGELEDFCSRHRFQRLDIDTSLKIVCTHPDDFELYNMMVQEIEAYIADNGGNLGAASDYARFLIPVISLGTYSDFDTHIDLSGPYSPRISINAPVLFDAGSVKQGPSEMQKTFNTCIIAWACDEYGVMHPDALLQLRDIQKGLIADHADVVGALDRLKRYLGDSLLLPRYYHWDALQVWVDGAGAKTPTTLRSFIDYSCCSPIGFLRFLTPEIRKAVVLPGRLNVKLTEALDNWEWANPTALFNEEEINIILSAYSPYLVDLLRSSLMNKPTGELDWTSWDTLCEVIAAIKNDLIRESKCLLSGAGAVYFHSGSEIHTMRRFTYASLDGNALFEHFHSSQSDRIGTPKEQSKEVLQQRGDYSWMPKGLELVRLREANMDYAARVLQKAYRFFIKPEVRREVKPEAESGITPIV